ncbi:hypothetical protein [Vulcanisaeta distributa]|uniref:Uncharacterized protein n=1 Tax=Vulcanisaeta distributa (strain DSM 14429 / JCM 11212 / NBRC 100878 / IC-017) TaxID=572478 RepID=E1QV82_VULDI|nr:hypothetical protein [Vulcanisaeta distributa]ADN50009.1 conserved hypothetical protein [Vulcanisaeta distributa DSM 14429]
MGKIIKRCREKFLDCAFDVIVKARLGLVDKDEALDALWEYLVNIDYEVRMLERRVSMSNTTEKETNNGEYYF